MNVDELSYTQKQLRGNIRSFLLVATLAELRRELEISNERGDKFRAACIQELIEDFDINS